MGAVRDEARLTTVIRVMLVRAISTARHKEGQDKVIRRDVPASDAAWKKLAPKALVSAIRPQTLLDRNSVSMNAIKNNTLLDKMLT